MTRLQGDFEPSRLVGQSLSRRAALRVSAGAGVAALATIAPIRSLGAQEATPGADETPALVLGGLLSLTGEWSTLGIASEAALELATQDINAELESVGSPARIHAVVGDTRLEPERALEVARTLADQGATVFIGPQSSSEVAAVKDFVDANDLLLMSQGSTASSLAIADDNVFRVVPTDVPEVEAVIALLQQDGIEVVVPIWRDDDGNTGLHDSMARLFPESGGTVVEGVEYAAGTEDFSEVLAVLRDQVEAATREHDSATVAVFLATFDDVTPLFAGAATVSSLAGVRWYGTDGSARVESLPADADAAAFAIETGYVAALLGLSESTRPRWQPVADRIAAITGQQPDAFGLAAYDAAWLAALAFIETGGSGDVTGLKAAAMRTADRTLGVTGPMALNEAGDRATGDFDFWAIAATDGGHEWQRVARYVSATGEVTHDDAGAEAMATPTG